MDQQTTPKTGRIRTENVKSILKAAELEFATKGYNGASMNAIAQRANMARTNVHYYFKNKLALYGAVLKATTELWGQAFEEVQVTDDPSEALAQYIHTKVLHSKENPMASKLFASEMLHGAPHLDDYLQTDHRQWTRDRAQVIYKWIEQGKMDAVDPYYLIFMIWATTQHYADFDAQVTSVFEKEQLEEEDYEDIARNVIHIILKGCGLKVPPHWQLQA